MVQKYALGEEIIAHLGSLRLSATEAVIIAPSYTVGANAVMIPSAPATLASISTRGYEREMLTYLSKRRLLMLDDITFLRIGMSVSDN
jgi:hypothetical protein